MMSASSMKDKVVAITGGAQGIGFSLAQLLARQGAALSLADVQKAKLDEAGAELARLGAKVMVTVVDVRDTEQVDAWIEDTVKAFGRLDGAANLAGIFKITGPIVDAGDDEFKDIMDINVTGMFKCLRAEMRAMENNGGGNIVNAASMAAKRATATFSAYCASKHAVLSLTACAAKEGGSKGIRVNAVCPGFVNTTMVTNIEEQRGAKFASTNVMGRRAEPEEVAKLILFLLGEDSSFINGTDINLDGGGAP